MLLLLTNDDGIDAPGLLALETAAASWGEVMVVAPTQARSGYSHRTTTLESLKIQECGSNRYSCSGTPVDCVRVALAHMNVKPDYVLSGVNHGANLGIDIYMSGTTAAAREAALHGITAFALSQYHKPNSTIDWQLTSDGCRQLFPEYANKPLNRGEFWNINLPDQHEPAAWTREMPAATKEVNPDPSPLALSYRMASDGLQYQCDYHERPRMAGLDVETCFNGSISVSKISLFQPSS